MRYKRKCTTIPNAYKHLMVNILHQALDDAGKAKYKDEVVLFANSAYCEQICDTVDIDYNKYLTQIKKKANNIKT